MIVHDLDGRIAYWNHGAEALYGWSRDEAMGKDIGALLQTRLPKAGEDSGETLLRAGQWRGVLVRTARNGAQVVVASQQTVRRDEHSAPAAILELDRDAAQPLHGAGGREGQAQYNSVLDYLHEGIVMQNAAGEIVACNPAAERILGLTRDQMMGRVSVDPRWRSIREDGSAFPGDTHPAMVSLRTGQVQRHVVMGVHTPDGELRWMRINAIPLFQEAGRQPYAAVTSFADITALKQAEIRLAESEARYRRLAENARDIILRYRYLPAPGLDYVNPAAADILGYGLDELYADPGLAIRNIHPEDRQRLQAIAASGPDALAGRQVFRFLRPDGAVLWMESVLAPIRDADGQVTAVEGIIRDVTENKQIEAELRLQGEIVGNMAEGVCLIQPGDGAILYANPTLERMFGYTPGELAGQPVRTLNSPGTGNLKATMCAMLDRLAETGAWSGELEFVRKDGAVFWCRASVSAFDHPQRGPVWINVLQDITERRRVEIALRESEETFRQFVEQSSEGFMLVDEEGRVIEWNRRLQHLTGVSREEALGGRIWDVHGLIDKDQAQPAESREARDARILSALRTGQSPMFSRIHEEGMIGQDGQLRTVQLALFPIRTGKGYRLGAIMHDATEARRAQDALRESEKRLATIFSSSPSSACIARLQDGLIRDANQAFADLVGYSRDEMVGRSFLDIGLLDHPEDVAAYLKALLETGRIRDREMVFCAKNGQARDALVCAEVVELDGEPYVIATGIDITWRKYAEEALRESELQARERAAEWQTVLDAAPVNIWVARDPDCRVIHGNRAASALLRMPAGSNQAKTTPEAPETSHYRVYRQGRELSVDEMPIGLAARGMQVRDFEETVVFDDGATRHLTGNAAPLRDARGRVRGAVAAFIDITERKQAEEALRDSEARFRLLFENSRAAVIHGLPDGAILAANPEACRVLGRTEADIRRLGRSGVADASDPRVAAAVAEHMRTGSFRGELTYLRADGTPFPVEVASTFFTAPDGQQQVIMSFVDITERRRAEESLRRSQKLEALSTLAGGIAHHLNNLLLAISGNAKLAADDLPPDQPAQESLAEIVKASARAAGLVRQVQAFGRHQDQERQVALLQPVVEGALELLRVTLPPAIRLETRFARPVPPVSCSADQIRQVVAELIANAAQAITSQRGSDVQGRIEVCIDVVDIDAAMAGAVPDLRPGRYVQLRVSDDGPGLDQAALQRIFEPFFTTRPISQGTGLGLSMVHGIVRSHGGAIAVASQPGQGAVFRLYFPAVEAAAPSPPTDLPAMAPGQGERVMIVDDEDGLVFLLSRALRRLGYAPSGFTDPVAALQAFRARPAAFDAVVTDLSMPNLNGFDLARDLLALRPDLPIVMTTGYVRPEDQGRVAQIGIRELILKPNTVDEMGQKLDRLLRGLRRPQPG